MLHFTMDERIQKKETQLYGFVAKPSRNNTENNPFFFNKTIYFSRDNNLQLFEWIGIPRKLCHLL